MSLQRNLPQRCAYNMQLPSIVKLLPVASLLLVVVNSRTVPPEERWRHSVAMKPTSNGVDKPYDVIERGRDSFINVLFPLVVHNAIKRGQPPKCDLKSGKRCMLAHNSPGRIGETYYQFEDPAKNIRGNSSQVILVCRCVDYNCRHAIVMQPRLISNVQQVACLYPKVQGKWRDCHTEILRTAETDLADLPPDVDGTEPYRVIQDNHGYWEVKGKRRIITLEEDDNLSTYETISFAEIVSDFEKAFSEGRMEDWFIFGNDTRGDDTTLDSFLVDDDSDECSKIYAYARRSADKLSAQQDLYAIGLEKSSYISARPEPVSSTDAILAIGAACESARRDRHLREPTLCSVRRERRVN